MSLLVATQLTALATAVLAVGAVFTAIFAVLAFRKQSQEVSAIEKQVTDQQELTQQQAELLRLQSRQLEVQQQQFTDQREANARQAKIFELQAAELRQSILERAIEEEERRRAQASLVFIREDRNAEEKSGRERSLPYINATVLNSSDQPVYNAQLQWQRGSAKLDNLSPEQLGMIMPGAETYGSRKFASDADMAANNTVLTFRDAAGVTWISRPDGTLRDQQAERRASASFARKAAGRLTREIQDL